MSKAEAEAAQSSSQEEKPRGFEASGFSIVRRSDEGLAFKW
jgi:hypothetical protein